MVMTLAEQQGLVKRAATPADLLMAIVFIDLSSFTPLAEAMGDVAAAGVLERFSRIVRNSVGAWSGRIVKQIGDAFMLVFPDARSAVACALEIESRASKEPQFPAVRAGIPLGHRPLPRGRLRRLQRERRLPRRQRSWPASDS